MDADEPARRAGRPTLTERRKADTRTEVSRVAVRLFAERGFDATTVEDIADAGGMALRTFYRYFRGKEETVVPVLAAGVSDWVDRLAGADPALDLVPAMSLAFRASTRRSRDVDDVDEARLRAVLRTVDGHPALRAVWLAVHHDCERRLRPVIAARAGADPERFDVHLAAGSVNTAVRIAMQHWAAEDDAGDPADRVADALASIADGGLLNPRSGR